tara:strand:+ start:266 stop:478 length:213 start_codon:yes stop_codon:yes gene_type:complete
VVLEAEVIIAAQVEQVILLPFLLLKVILVEQELVQVQHQQVVVEVGIMLQEVMDQVQEVEVLEVMAQLLL